MSSFTKNIFKYLFIFNFVAIMSSCGLFISSEEEFKRNNGSHYKIGNPYNVEGIEYTPEENYYYSEEGMASWYGPNFHGLNTANGGVFDMNEVSAAHRTLPIPSVVRVTNLNNGRTMKIKITDRGPFANDRILDLSAKAAELLAMKEKGTALVHVAILKKESKLMKKAMLEDRKYEPSISETVNLVDLAVFKRVFAKKKGADFSGKGQKIIVGVFSKTNLAQLVYNSIPKLETRVIVPKIDSNGNKKYVVKVGPYRNHEDLENASKYIISKGLTPKIEEHK